MLACSPFHVEGFQCAQVKHRLMFSIPSFFARNTTAVFGTYHLSPIYGCVETIDQELAHVNYYEKARELLAYVI